MSSDFPDFEEKIIYISEILLGADLTEIFDITYSNFHSDHHLSKRKIVASGRSYTFKKTSTHFSLFSNGNMTGSFVFVFELSQFQRND